MDDAPLATSRPSPHQVEAPDRSPRFSLRGRRFPGRSAKYTSVRRRRRFQKMIRMNSGRRVLPAAPRTLPAAVCPVDDAGPRSLLEAVPSSLPLLLPGPRRLCTSRHTWARTTHSPTHARSLLASFGARPSVSHLVQTRPRVGGRWESTVRAATAVHNAALSAPSFVREQKETDQCPWPCPTRRMDDKAGGWRTTVPVIVAVLTLTLPAGQRVMPPCATDPARSQAPMLPYWSFDKDSEVCTTRTRPFLLNDWTRRRRSMLLQRVP